MISRAKVPSVRKRFALESLEPRLAFACDGTPPATAEFVDSSPVSEAIAVQVATVEDVDVSVIGTPDVDLVQTSETTFDVSVSFTIEVTAVVESPTPNPPPTGGGIDSLPLSETSVVVFETFDNATVPQDVVGGDRGFDGLYELGTEAAIVSDAVGDSSLQVTYTSDETSTLVTEHLGEFENLYVSFDHQLEDGFDGYRNLKVARWFDAKGEYHDGFDLLLWGQDFTGSGRDELLNVFEHSGEFAYQPYDLPAGEWVRISFMLKMNDVVDGRPVENGSYQLWRDEELIYSRDDLVFRDSLDVDWFERGGLSLLNNYSGAGVAPQPSLVRRLDDALVLTNVGDEFTHARALDAIYAELGR